MSKNKNFKEEDIKEDINKEQEEEIVADVVDADDKKADDNTENTEEPAEEKDPLTVAEEKIAELTDKYLRSVAEFDNYRKRTIKEKAELILNGSEKAVSAILPIIDDMERAIANGEKTDDPEVLKEGMVLIHQKFIKTLENMGVKQIDAKDKDFNTDYHEAIAMVPGMGDDKKGKVIDCVLTGYTLNDKVIRHSKVAVGQ